MSQGGVKSVDKNLEKQGFTLIEILIAVAVFIFLASLGLFLSSDFYATYSSNYERDLVVIALQKARSRAMANINQSSHGFCKRANNYLVFEGEDCDSGLVKDKLPASKNIQLVFEEVNFNPGGGLPEIVFNQLEGGSETAGSLILRQGTRQAVIWINPEGAISW